MQHPVTLKCRLQASLAVLVVAALFTGFAAPSQAKPFRVVAFAGASNWPLWVAQDHGLFAKEGLDVSFDITPNSVELAKNLHDGRYDLALTSIDNVVAYDEGQGEADLGGPARFVALFGVDDGLLSLVSKPEIGSIAALKGRSVAVDALTTGYVFALREVLVRHGLQANDVALVRVGGGAQRLEALLSGRTDATLLNVPLDLVAQKRGFVILAKIRNEIGPYMGVVGVTTRDAATLNRAEIEKFIRAFAAGVAWLADPKNRAAAVDLLAARAPMPLDVADRTYDALVRDGGIFRDLKIDHAGVATVLALRSRYASQRTKLTDPSRYFDDSLRLEALGR